MFVKFYSSPPWRGNLEKAGSATAARGWAERVCEARIESDPLWADVGTFQGKAENLRKFANAGGCYTKG